MAQPTVIILTWCKDPEALYGTTLTFETIRVGFPNCPVFVYDNASDPSVRDAIKEAASRADCFYWQLTQEVSHAGFVANLIATSPLTSIVLVDPDVMFWQPVETWTFHGKLMAGRLIPEFEDEYSGARTLARLHTSHLWFPDLPALRDEIARVKATYWEWSPMAPRMQRMGADWVRWDTGASLFHALPERCHAFGEAELDCYDHLFCGSHLSLVAPKLSDDRFTAVHAAARQDYRTLRGIWRPQQLFFESRRVDRPLLV